jgi:CheY-like chemotaxis protein
VVLIVDDDPDAREVVAAILRHYGAKVIVATSVSTAMVALRREKQVDVLIADLGMPVEDGYDLIRQVRDSEEQRIAAMPAAALTAYTTEEDRDRVLAAGFQFHLAKPVDPAVLVATVDRLRTGNQSIH